MSQPAQSGEVIDGIAATVNGVAILYSDVDEACRGEALLEGRGPAIASASERDAVLQRLIDQELLRQQMADTFPPAKPEEIAGRIRQVKCSFGIGGPCEGEHSVAGQADRQASKLDNSVLEQAARPAGQAAGATSADDQAWRSLLSSYGLTEEELAERIAAQMRITAFIESRLQPSVHVDAASVQAYYQEKFLPELRQRGVQTEPPLTQVSGQIEEILRQQRVDQMLSSWLQTLRQQSRIRVGPELLPPPADKAGRSGEGVTARPGR
jgi:hypothetical protein